MPFIFVFGTNTSLIPVYPIVVLFHTHLSSIMMYCFKA